MTIYNCQPSQNIYDVCILLYGSLDYYVKLMVDNNLSGTAIDLTGKSVVYDESLFFNRNEVYLNNIPPVNNLYYAQPNQSIYDVCLQLTASLDGLVDFMKANNINGVNDTDVSGRSFIFDTSVNVLTVNSNNKSSVKYATLFMPPNTIYYELRDDFGFELRDDLSRERNT